MPCRTDPVKQCALATANVSQLLRPCPAKISFAARECRTARMLVDGREGHGRRHAGSLPPRPGDSPSSARSRRHNPHRYNSRRCLPLRYVQAETFKWSADHAASYRHAERIAICPARRSGYCELQFVSGRASRFLAFSCRFMRIGTLARFSLYIPCRTLQPPFPQ
jgi:hypothetical protein